MRHLEMEYSLDIKYASEAIKSIRDVIKNNKLKVNFPLEIRFVKADDYMMSPDYGRTSVRLGIYTVYKKDALKYFELAEKEMIKFGGRPHFAKEFYVK